MRWSILRWVFAVVCLAVVFVPIDSRAQEAPAPTQAQYGEDGGMFSQVDPRTGAMTYVYSFDLPNARGLSGPTLALRYNSSMGDGSVAYGWSLGIPTIERKPLSGLPRSTPSGEPLGGERYTFDGQPLVKLCVIGGACPPEPFTSGHPTWADGWSYFRLQNEGLFARFYMSPTRSTFRAVFKGGDMVEFGLPLADGGFATFGLTTFVEQWTEKWDNGITRWLPSIRRSLNHPNNVIAYRWSQLGSRGIAYLTDIWDTPPSAGAASPAQFEHHTQLFWSPVPDAGFSHAPPFRARPDFQLDRVGVASMPWSGVAPREVYRLYTLSYTAPRGSRPAGGWTSSAELSPLWQHSFLRQIQQQGHCPGNVEDANGGIPQIQCQGLPPVSFEYEPAVPTLFDAHAPEIQSGPPDLVLNNAVLPDPANAGIIDFDRDGRPDVVQSWPEKCDNGTKSTVLRLIDAHLVVVCVDALHPEDSQILRWTRPMLGYRNLGPTIGAPAGKAFDYTCMDAGPWGTEPNSLSTAQGPQGAPFPYPDRLPAFFASQGNTTLGAFGSGSAIWGQNAYFPIVARFIGNAPGGPEPQTSGCHLNSGFDPNAFHPSWRWQTMAVEPWQKRAPRTTWENSAPEWNVDIDGDGYPDRLTRHPGPTLGVYARATPTFTRRVAAGESYPLPPPNGTSMGPALVPFAFSFPPDANSIVPVEPNEVWDKAVNANNRQRVYYTDINGDGFPDAVSRDYLVPGGIRVRPGDGKGNFRCLAADPWPCTDEVLEGVTFSSYYELDIVAPHMPWDLYPGAPNLTNVFFELADVSGDGLSDIVRMVPDGANPRQRVEVWVNLDGHRFECVGAPADPCLAGYVNIGATPILGKPRLTFADMDSDGVNEIVVLTQKGAIVGKLNATPVQGAAGERAVRPAQLIRVSNGRGARTEVKYKTVQELEKEAASSGTPWIHRSPVVESVVTEMRTHNEEPGGPTKPAPFGIDRYMRFTYREPGYDNWTRRFVGFRKVAVRNGFDQAITETTYWLGPCENGDTPAENAPAFCPMTSDDEQPSSPSYRAWVGRPMRVDRYVPETPNQAAAKYLWSRTFEYDPPQVLFAPGAEYPEIDRHVTFAFAKRVETHLYRPEEATSPGYNYPTLVGGDDIEQAPHQVGHRIVASTVRMDTNGTVVEQASLGEEAALDYARVTQYSSIPYGASPEVTCDANWNCLPTNVTVFSQGGGTGATNVHRKQRLTYDGSADLRKVEAELDTDQVVSRYHPAGAGAYSASAPGAAVAGWKTQAESEYSPDGVLVLAKGPGDATTPRRTCARSTLDATYGHFPEQVAAFTAACDSGPSLITQISFDRDFGVPVTVTAPDLGVSMIVLDAFGRVQETYAPDPDALVGTPRLVADATYSDFGSAPSVEARRYTSSFTYIRSVGILNALLEPVMGFQQADGSDWTVQGWTARDAAGRAIKTYRGFGTPASSLGTALGAGSVPLPAFGSYEPILDVFGRSVGTKENGVQITERKLSPLAIEVRDQEQLPGGSHPGAFARIETNGRGEVVHVARHGNGGVVDTWNTLDGMGQPIIIDRTGPGAGPYARSMVWDSFGRIVENAERNAMDRATGRTIRYAFDDNNRLAGTSDGRGCGEDLYYDALGRLVGENYSPCTASQPPYSEYVPLGAPNGLEVEYRYDEYDPSQVNPEPGFADDPGLAAGRLTARIDRGSETHFNFDARGRTRRVSRRVAKPLSQQAPGTDPFAAHWFRQRIDFDVADRMRARTTGVEDSELLAGGAGVEGYNFSPRGLLRRITNATQPIIDNIAYRPDGLVDQTTYGDLALTKAKLTYDDARLRLATYRISRFTQSLWTSSTANYSTPGPDTTQTTLADFRYEYDLVGNPEKIDDATPIAGFSEDAWPVSQRRIWNDDFYRVTRVTYGYGSPNGTALYLSPFRSETLAGDTRPVSRASLPRRVSEQTFAFDFMGNTTATTDDRSAMYDRSLGTITNGDGTGWGPNQLTATAGNAVRARYDEAGNLIELKVERPGSCPSGAGSHCAQWYAYEWDEIGQLSRARRWDYPTALPSPAGDVPDEDPAWDLRYAYSGGVRVLKTSKDSLGVERHTLEVFDTLRFQHDEYIPAASDYEHHRAATHVYLGGGAGHMFYDDSLPAPPGTSFARTYINIGDHLGSTSVVIDKTTSELVERSTFMAYGAIESAHRPARWSHAREPYKFTGKEEDIEVGATYFGARYYNAHLGRFMSPDPLTIHGFSSDMNPYAYVRGRVMSHVDPLGLADQQAQEQAKAGADANLPGTGGLGPPTPVLGHHDFGGWTVDVTGPAGPATNPFAAQTGGSGMGGPMVSPDTSGIGGLETLDRGNGSAPGWSAPRGNHLGLDDVGDTKWMDDRGSNLAKHPEAIAPEAAAWTGVVLAAVVINVALAELSAASAAAPTAGGGGFARWAVSSLLTAIGNKAQGCSSGCSSDAGKQAVASVVQASGKSIQAAVRASNSAGLSQSQVIDAITQVTKGSGRELYQGILVGQPGTITLVGAQFVPGAPAPVVIVGANGTAVFGTGIPNFAGAALEVSGFLPK